jgi:O-antigen ligase
MILSAEKRTVRNYWGTLLTVILLLRISSYFMISDDIAVTQFFKTGLRLALTFICGILFLRHHKNVLPFKHVNWLPVAGYIAYLALGASSLLWSTGFHDSLLQLVMDLETFVFVFFFMQVFYATCKNTSAPSSAHAPIPALPSVPAPVPALHSALNSALAPVPNSVLVPVPVPSSALSNIISLTVFLTGVGFALGLYFNPDAFYRLTHGGEVSRLGGFIINPNELGMLLVVGITAYLFDFFKEGKLRIRNLLAISFLIWLLLLTGSRSSFIALMLVIAIYALTRPGKLFKVAMLGAGFLLAVFTGYKVFVKMGDTAEVMSMTGRIPFWSDLIHYNFPKEPWLGFGYMRIDYTDKFDSLNAYAGAMTHNTFLQVLLGLGLTGLFLVLIQLGLFTQASLQNRNIQVRRYIMLSFIPLFINSLTEFGIFGETNYGILFYLMLNFYAIQEPRFESLRIKRHVQNAKRRSGLPLRSGDAAPVATA